MCYSTHASSIANNMSTIIVASLILGIIRLSLGACDLAVNVENDGVRLNNTANRFLQTGLWCMASPLVPETVVRNWYCPIVGVYWLALIRHEFAA